mmetsp:Transcript_33503/g.52132  ORF Transcript_33503/g.52132 Transcript_33503/m.52132 type:complete len:245 (+) Transcript_33503:36-770(+)
MESVQRYDKNVSEFSPRGRLYQLEYSDLASIMYGKTCIASKGAETISLIIENRAEKDRQIPGDNLDLVEYGKNFGFICSGYPIDQLLLSQEIIELISGHLIKTNLHFTMEEVVQKVSNMMQYSTQFANKRLKSAKTIFMSTSDERGPQICKCETSGLISYTSFCAIGKKEKELNASFQTRSKKKTIIFKTVEEVIIEPIKILQSVTKDDLKSSDLSIFVNKNNSGFRRLKNQEIDKYLSKLDKY